MSRPYFLPSLRRKRGLLAAPALGVTLTAHGLLATKVAAAPGNLPAAASPTLVSGLGWQENPLASGSAQPTKNVTRKDFATALDTQISLFGALRSWRETLRGQGQFARREYRAASVSGQKLTVSVGRQELPSVIQSWSGARLTGATEARFGALSLGSTYQPEALQEMLEGYDKATDENAAIRHDSSRLTWMTARAVEAKNAGLQLSMARGRKDLEAGEAEEFVEGSAIGASGHLNLPLQWKLRGNWTRSSMATAIEDATGESWDVAADGPIVHPWGQAKATASWSATDHGFSSLAAPGPTVGKRTGSVALQQDVAVGFVSGSMKLRAARSSRAGLGEAAVGEQVADENVEGGANFRVKIAPRLSLVGSGVVRTGAQNFVAQPVELSAPPAPRPQTPAPVPLNTPGTPEGTTDPAGTPAGGTPAGGTPAGGEETTAETPLPNPPTESPATAPDGTAPPLAPAPGTVTAAEPVPVIPAPETEGPATPAPATPVPAPPVPASPVPDVPASTPPAEPQVTSAAPVITPPTSVPPAQPVPAPEPAVPVVTAPLPTLPVAPLEPSTPQTPTAAPIAEIPAPLPVAEPAAGGTEETPETGQPSEGKEGPAPDLFARDGVPLRSDVTQAAGGDVGLEFKLSRSLAFTFSTGYTRTVNTRYVFDDWEPLALTDENRFAMELRQRTGRGSWGMRVSRKLWNDKYDSVASLTPDQEATVLRLETETRLIGPVKISGGVDWAQHNAYGEQLTARRVQANLHMAALGRFDVRLTDGPLSSFNLLPNPSLDTTREVSFAWNTGSAAGGNGFGLAVEYARREVTGTPDSHNWRLGVTYR